MCVCVCVCVRVCNDTVCVLINLIRGLELCTVKNQAWIMAGKIQNSIIFKALVGA